MSQSHLSWPPAVPTTRQPAGAHQRIAVARHGDRRLAPLEGVGGDLALRLLGVEPLAVHGLNPCSWRRASGGSTGSPRAGWARRSVSAARPIPRSVPTW